MRVMITNKKKTLLKYYDQHEHFPNLIKALLHGGIFHATCNAILHLRDVN